MCHQLDSLQKVNFQQVGHQLEKNQQVCQQWQSVQQVCHQLDKVFNRFVISWTKSSTGLASVGQSGLSSVEQSVQQVYHQLDRVFNRSIISWTEFSTGVQWQDNLQQVYHQSTGLSSVGQSLQQVCNDWTKFSTGVLSVGQPAAGKLSAGQIVNRYA